MEKKIWSAPEFLELGVQSTECLPEVPGGWNKPSGNTCGNTFGNTFGHNSGHNSGRRW